MYIGLNYIHTRIYGDLLLSVNGSRRFKIGTNWGPDRYVVDTLHSLTRIKKFQLFSLLLVEASFFYSFHCAVENTLIVNVFLNFHRIHTYMKRGILPLHFFLIFLSVILFICSFLIHWCTTHMWLVYYLTDKWYRSVCRFASLPKRRTKRYREEEHWKEKSYNIF